MKENKAKRANTTTVKSKQPKSRISIIEKSWNYHDLIAQGEAFLFFPGKHEWRQRFIYTMRSYFANSPELIFEFFLVEYKIPVRTFYEWVDAHEDIRLAYEDVKEAIAVKRKKLVYEAAPTTLLKDMHDYNQRWSKNVDHYHADLSKKDDQQPTKIEVFMEPAKDAGIKPAPGKKD